MNPPTWLSRWRRQLVAAAAAVMMLLTGVLSAQAVSTPPSVTGWIRHNATVLDTVDPAAPLDDLAPLGQSIGNAKVVGLGESTHGAAEEARCPGPRVRQERLTPYRVLSASSAALRMSSSTTGPNACSFTSSPALWKPCSRTTANFHLARMR